MSERKGLRFDDVVENLVPDPYHVPDYVVVSGLIGKSNQEGYVRIYTTPDLKTWLEIAKDDILHSEELEDQGSRVWLRDGAKVQQVTSSSLTAQNGFLQGKLAAAHLGAAAPSAPASQVNAGNQAVQAPPTPECSLTCLSCSCTCTCTCTCLTCTCPAGYMEANGLNAWNQAVQGFNATIVDCTFNCTITCRTTQLCTMIPCTTACRTIACPGANDFTAVINPGNINPQSTAAVTPPQVNPNIAPRRTT